MNNNAKAAISLAALVVGSYLVIMYLLPLFTPFVIALFLAVMIEPAVRLVQKSPRISRGLAVGIVLIVLAIVLGLIVTLAVAEIAREVDQLSRNLGGLSRSFGEALDNLMAKAEDFYAGLPIPLVEAIKANQDRLFQFVRVGVSGVASFIGGLPQFTLVFMLSVISTFFISRDHMKLSEALLRIMPRSWRKQARKVRGELLSGFVGYLRSRFVLMCITGVMTVIGFSIMGINYAWLLGLVCAVLDLLPVIGPSLLILPWAGYHFIVGHFGLGLGLIVVLAVNSVVRQMAEGKVMGENLGLHPLVALISIYVGIRLFGTKGFIAGPLAVIFIKAVLHSVILPVFPLDEE
ncbi:MAG: sporulation integral membrane protein YtvI [Bacillota bacterium]|nr:sporulation integral membrane protein YtvI [Bacillota bacterium]